MANGQRKYRVVIHYGELVLKGKNRPFFERCLRENIQTRLEAEAIELSIERSRNHFYINLSESQLGVWQRLSQILSEVAGVSWFALVQWLERVAEESDEDFLKRLEREAVEFVQAHASSGKSFAVRVKRVDKSFNLSSTEIEKRLGSSILEKTDWSSVNLSKPDFCLYLRLRNAGAYLYSKKQPGVSGVPVGTAGRVLTLISGGIDSPVAAYLSAKRGCTMDFIHFVASSLDAHELEHFKVARLVAHLSRYTLNSRLYLVPSHHFEVKAMFAGEEYRLLLFRRFMMKLSERLAQRSKAYALVSGDNLSQVFSQTLANLAIAQRAVSIPVLMPLVTYEKKEVIVCARSIGTYETSLEEYKDCCSLISGKPYFTSDYREIEEVESKRLGDYEEMLQKSLENAVCLKFESGRQVQEPTPVLKGAI